MLWVALEMGLPLRLLEQLWLFAPPLKRAFLLAVMPSEMVFCALKACCLCCSSNMWLSQEMSMAYEGTVTCKSNFPLCFSAAASHLQHSAAITKEELKKPASHL